MAEYTDMFLEELVRNGIIDEAQAAEMVSLSRISPTRMTSGSCRRARRMASAKEGTSLWTSRCVMMQVLLLW